MEEEIGLKERYFRRLVGVEYLFKRKDRGYKLDLEKMWNVLKVW